MAISKTLRYQVLRRDDHTCQYCGRTAPEVKLTIDHVVPEALGGADEPSNLVTACADCNGGKSATPPDAATVAGVSDDAIRWASAIQSASAAMMADLRRREIDRETFGEAWGHWGTGTGAKRQTVPLPADWETTIDRFVSLGLPMPILLDCVTAAMTAKNVTFEKTFNYFCGIAWNKVRQLQDSAREHLGGDQAEGGTDDSWPPAELVIALLGDYFEIWPKERDAAYQAAREDLAKPPDERSYPEYMDGFVVAAAFFLESVFSMIASRDFVINNFLRSVPTDLFDEAELETKAAYFKAGEPYVDTSEAAPQLLMHLGHIMLRKGASN